MRWRRLPAAAAKLHALVGVVCSLAAVLLGTTGALLIFRDDYVRATLPEARAPADLSPAALARVAEAAEAHFGAERLRALTFASASLGVHRAFLVDGGGAYLASDGRVIAHWSKNARVEDWLFDLHRHLLAGEVGKVVVGSVGLAALALTVSGVFAFWPARRGFRRGLQLGERSRAELVRAHRNLGALVAIPIALQALTGAGLAFPDAARGFVMRFVETAPRAASLGASPAEVDWGRAISNAAALAPGAALRGATWPSAERPAAIRLRQPSEWHPSGRSLATLDPSTGAILSFSDAAASGTGDRMLDALYPVHAARVAQPILDLLALAAGIGLALLGLSGALAFARRFGAAPARHGRASDPSFRA